MNQRRKYSLSIILTINLICCIGNLSFVKNADNVLKEARKQYYKIKNCSMEESVITEYSDQLKETKKEAKLFVDEELLYAKFRSFEKQKLNSLEEFYFYSENNNIIFVLNDNKLWNKILDAQKKNYYYYSASSLSSYYDIINNVDDVSKIEEIPYKKQRVFKIQGTLTNAMTRRWLLFEGFGSALEKLDYSSEYISKHFENLGYAKFVLYVDTTNFYPVEYSVDLTKPRNKMVDKSLDLVDGSIHHLADSIIRDLSEIRNAKGYVFNCNFSKVNSTGKFTVPKEVKSAKVKAIN